LNSPNSIPVSTVSGQRPENEERDAQSTGKTRVMAAIETSKYTKPRRLQRGDTVAVVSSSWGGPHTFPHVFDRGLSVLANEFGLRIKEMATARMSPTDLAKQPQVRAQAINEAFADPSVSAIVASIGGNDSARILRYLDRDLIKANPKIFMGYSDTTSQNVFLHNLGLVAFNGPAVMAGFAQLENFPEASGHALAILFEPTDTYAYQPFPTWTERYHDWNDPESNGRVGELHEHDGWHWLNGSGVHEGRLFGGCVEVLEFLKGTEHWPTQEFWNDRILFLETSEEKPTIKQVRYWLFNYGMQEVFDRAAGLIVGRARDYSPTEKLEFDTMIREVVVEQFGAADLAVVTNVDFGHTDPQWILPLGVRAELDVDQRSFRLLEPAVY
jgi:muramoyltetrapeptide carboxypeptidase LdcA involved in peptidoglycan recycling